MSSMTTSSSLPRISVTRLAIHLPGCRQRKSLAVSEEARENTHFFITCTLTFCISTFWLNSGGNLVLLSSFASTPVAMVAADFPGVCRTTRWGCGLLLG